MDWNKVQNDEGEWEYRYDDLVHSQDDLNKIINNGAYLGRTYTINNIYYSLLGSQLTADSFEGQIYQLVDKAIISRVNYIIVYFFQRNNEICVFDNCINYIGVL
mgnify:CR=1 FL=1